MLKRRGMRGAVATMLVTALIASGAVLGGSAAQAQELPAEPAAEALIAEAPVADAPVTEAPAAGEPSTAAPVTEAPTAETPEVQEAAPAQASVTATPAVVEAGLEGLTVETSLTNIPAGPGVYVAVIDEGTSLDLTMENMGLAMEYNTATGNVTSTLQVPAGKLDRAKGYEVVAWKAHTAPSAETIFVVAPILVSDAQWDAVFGAVEPPAKEWTPAIEVFLEGAATPLAAGETVYKGDVLTVRGTGFDPESHPATGRPPITKGDPTGNYVTFGNFAQAWRPSGGIASSDRVVASQKWAMTDATFKNISPNFINGVRGDRVVLNTDGSFEAGLELQAAPTAKGAPANGSYGVFTYVAGGGANDAAQELELRLEYIDEERPVGEEWTPAIEVFLSGSETPLEAGATVYKSDVLTVRGTGFDPESHPATGRPPITKGDPTGNYVTFGSFAQEWQPSGGAAPGNRVVADQRWAMTDATFDNINEMFQSGVVDQRVVLNPDGSFVADLEAQAIAADKKAPVDGSYGVFTYVAGGGANDAAQELGLRLEYIDAVRPESAAPTIKVFREGSSTPLAWGAKVYAGDKLTVQGSGFDPESHPATGRPPVTKGDPTGNYVTFGNFAQKWQPSAGVKSADRVVADQRWAMTDATFNNLNPKYVPGVIDERVVLETDGTFTADLEVQQIPSKETAPEGGTYGVFTYVAGGGENDATQELSVRLEFVNSERPVDPKPKPEPKPDPVAPIPGTKQPGSLVWSVSSAFANYATGSIAKGSVTTNGVGGSGGSYVFPQVSSSWNAESQTGSVQFSGVVTFSGHKGAMTETFSNPVITVHSATSGTISAGGHSFGLNLGAASKSVGANGEVTWRGVPVAGSISGGGSDGGGTGGGAFAVDALTFTVGEVNNTSYGSTSVESTSGKKRKAADAPPATSGITMITDPSRIVPGGDIEFEATGFEPNERDILVVLYSEPTLLDDNAGANKTGTVRWLGTLPEDITPGEHTLTLQGSTNAGVKITVLEKEANEKTAKSSRAVAAAVNDAELASAGLLSNTGTPMWVWWAGAAFLLILAATTTGLVVAQRRGNQ